MLKPLVDLSSKYHKYRNVSHDFFLELLKGHELKELFDNCESDHAIVIDFLKNILWHLLITRNIVKCHVVITFLETIPLSKFSIRQFI